MSTKGSKSSSVDFDYFNDAKVEKGKKKVKEQAETAWKGPSHKERREDAAAEKAQKAMKKRTAASVDKGSWKKKFGGLIAILFLCGVGLFNFLSTLLGALAGDGVTFLDVHDTARLKDVLFGGQPWLVYCVNNDTKKHRLPSVLEEGSRELYRNIGLHVGVLPCWDKTESGRSVAQRFKFREKPPLAFLVANGNKPRTMNLLGVTKAEEIEKKAKPALTLETHRIDSLKRWPTHCTSRRTCVVIGHKQVSQRDSALKMIRPLMESHRSLAVVTLDTSFWSLKLDEEVLKRRPPQVKGSYRADVLCLAREDGAKGNATHHGNFLEELDSRSAANFLTACEKRENLVRIGVPPRIKARPSKPKKVKAPPPPPPRQAPTPPPRSKDPRSSGGSARANVDRVGSRDQMEAAAAEEALFEAVDEEEEATDGDNTEAEDSSDEADEEGEEVDDDSPSDDTESSDEEVEL